jgi:hypothetical protein
MADNKVKKSKKYVKTYDDMENPADTDNFPAPEFVVKPAPGDTGYNIVAAAFHDQTDYFRPGIRSVNHDISKERNKKETSRRVYEHVHSFDAYLIIEGSDITLEEILDWASTKIIDKDSTAEAEIEKFAKSKKLQPEDLAKLAAHLLKSELGYNGSKKNLDLDQNILTELIKKIDDIYGTKTDI